MSNVLLAHDVSTVQGTGREYAGTNLLGRLSSDCARCSSDVNSFNEMRSVKDVVVSLTEETDYTGSQGRGPAWEHCNGVSAVQD